MKNASRDAKAELSAFVTTISLDNPIPVKINLNETPGSVSILNITDSAVIEKFKELTGKNFYFQIRIDKIENRYTDFIFLHYSSVLGKLLFDAGNNFTELDNSDIKFIEEESFKILPIGSEGKFKSYKVNAINIYRSDKVTILYSYMSQS
jgi:hypothetical protein